MVLGDHEVAGDGLHLVDEDCRDAHVPQIPAQGVEVPVEVPVPERKLVADDAVHHDNPSLPVFHLLSHLPGELVRAVVQRLNLDDRELAGPGHLCGRNADC